MKNIIIENINFEDILESTRARRADCLNYFIKDSLEKILQNEGFIQGIFNMAKNRTDFGFCQSAFAHISRFPKINEFNGAEVICSVEENAKGEEITSIARAEEFWATEVGQKFKIMARFDGREKFEDSNLAIATETFSLETKKAELRETAKATLGFYAVQKAVRVHNSYGCWTQYDFVFSEEITKDKFIKYLQLEGIRTEAEYIDAPVLQGEIEFYHHSANEWSVKIIDPYCD